MKGITFGNYHSFDDFSLVLNSKEIGSPNVKVKEIEIPGADGTLDLTDFFGEAKYENVTHKFQFQTIVPQSQFLSLFSNIKNKIHGKKIRIILDDDPSFYYIGRCFVSAFTNEKCVGNVSVECVCEPWKYKMNETIVSVTVDGSSNNALNVRDLREKGKNLYLSNDDYFIFDVENGNVVTYENFFSNKNDRVLPNQQYSFVVEIKERFVKNGMVQIVLISNYDSGNTCFTGDVRLNLSDENDSIKIFSKNSQDSSWVSSATLFMRSYLDIRQNAKANAIFRISAIPGEVSIENFIYTSFDGTLKGLKLLNGRKKSVPTITASNPFTIYFEGGSYSISAGTFVIPEIELKEGINDIAVKGNGTISFTYQEGDL